MNTEIINTNEYIRMTTFASKVGENSSLIRYYAQKGRLNSITVDGRIFIHKEEVNNWPPKRIRSGPKPKLKGKSND